MALRKSLLSADEIPDAGADDSNIAMLIALKGYGVQGDMHLNQGVRVLTEWIGVSQLEDQKGTTLGYALHAILTKVLKSKNLKCNAVFLEKFYLHIINPWFLALGVVLTAVYLPKIFLILLLALFITLVIPHRRELVKAWIPNQFFLIMAQFKALRDKVSIWKKERAIVILSVFCAFLGLP